MIAIFSCTLTKCGWLSSPRMSVCLKDIQTWRHNADTRKIQQRIYCQTCYWSKTNLKPFHTQKVIDYILLYQAILRCYMAEILSIRRKTLYNQSIKLLWFRRAHINSWSCFLQPERITWFCKHVIKTHAV